MIGSDDDRRKARQEAAKKIREAKITLGEMWGLSRPLHNSELARALRLTGKNPGRSIEDWAKEKTDISGPASVALELFLSGAKPPDPMDQILR